MKTETPVIICRSCGKPIEVTQGPIPMVCGLPRLRICSKCVNRRTSQNPKLPDSKCRH